MKELTIGGMKLTSNIYENYKHGCNVDIEMKCGYYGDNSCEDLKDEKIDLIIKFLQQHQKEVKGLE